VQALKAVGDDSGGMSHVLLLRVKYIANFWSDRDEPARARA
jgi:hypothetical protein